MFDNEAWVADEYNVGPAVAVEAEDESTSPAVSVEEQDEDRNSTLLYNEEPCLRGGGTCLPEIECPHGKLSDTRGLCPQQQSLGIECCHGPRPALICSLWAAES
ncbi:hypothetical protein B566_EDAN004111 [Ephemera danica]|nr:hypothetical protein B566_EDAN004111 [Ephemera danica]